MTHPARQPVLVLGHGASGRAAAKLLHQQGYVVTIADERAERGSLDPWAITSNLSASLVASAEFAVTSPGFALEHPWLVQLRAAGKRVIAEFEYGMAAMPGVRAVAITGSNGKSSVVKWIADTLSANGISAVPAGNYGLPPCDIATRDQHPDVAVVELSSFQIEQSQAFRAEIAILLNFAPNHLDRHGSMETYERAKGRLFTFMKPVDKAIVHEPMAQRFDAYVSAGTEKILFGISDRADYTARDGKIFHRGQPVVDLSNTWWARMPLLENAAAAMAVFDHFRLSREAVLASAKSFVPLPHRMEVLKAWRGIRFVNDSKASTMTALAAAVACGPEKKHLIAGGILKESDVSFVKEVLARHCAGIYCIGQSAARLIEAWSGVVPCVHAGTLEGALRRAMEKANAGETILLSPGCSSFDQFASYAERGDTFKELVLESTA